MKQEVEPNLLEMRKKINMMKDDRHQYKREAFIEVYEEYIEMLEAQIEKMNRF
ncbi:hypothetical protein BpOF4_15930 [Alkalihalophilus pseudofirmus OF4]|uniref:Uncharacterized protein n=1 Tax=Alkalihalophilus pseudofirmus (strain ATCC BAA-2126 / JCM 17055 / OF4) TaxID=398511 RepID=D3G0S3_ALKPO|nr:MULTISPECIES: hypothetical protein [Alkalihalophilus]ADC51235.1 hypothetical protein BpOF4_15930 [Alkalihalophilus pseudofirmus OF4]MED1601823.1 hypothetical protein [Alkalihalophilus marmarensis]WEG18438.1 hypothetical protein PQ478_08130 [Alkalihalophilus pseudofirmus]